tara:strand:+ start:307 stop:504 length:198 start_codon:yes stop_codon:yes gene_type:complete
MSTDLPDRVKQNPALIRPILRIAFGLARVLLRTTLGLDLDVSAAVEDVAPGLEELALAAKEHHED